MVLALTLLLSASSLPERVGLLVIDREAAAAGPALTNAARAQVSKLASEAIIDMRVSKRTTTCNLETFRALGVDTAFCGVSMPKSLSKLYVIESGLDNGRVQLTLAVFDRHALELTEKRPQKRVAVDSPETYARVLSEVAAR